MRNRRDRVQQDITVRLDRMYRPRQLTSKYRKWSIQVMSFRPNSFRANYSLNEYNMSYMYLNKIFLNQVQEILKKKTIGPNCD